VSVLGATIHRELAARVLERPDLLDASTWIIAFGDLFVLDGNSVRFGHDLVRVAAYEGLSVRRRKAVHDRAGDVIEAWGDTGPIEDFVAALAFHATGSGNASRIAVWSRRAADAALAKGAMDVAERLLDDVVVAQRELRASTQDRTTTYRDLALAAERAGHPETALDALARAAKLAAGNGRAEIAIDRVRMLEKVGRYRSALVTTARAARVCSDPVIAAHLTLARATIRNFLGQPRECLTLTRSLLDDQSLHDDKPLMARAHVLAEWSCASLGLPERVEHDRAAEHLLVELGDSIGLANLYLNRAEIAWHECRVDDSVADLRASSEYYRRAGDVIGAALADNNRAEMLTLQFHLDEAERLLTRARRITEAAGYPHGTTITTSGLARISAWRGDVAGALLLQNEALAGFERLRADDLVFDSIVRLVEIHVCAGDAQAALTEARRADAALARLGAVPVVPATLERLRARALLLDGRPAEARATFETAVTLGERDRSVYEVTLSSIGIGRIDGDERRIAEGLDQLERLGVLAPPPGT
jgi:tetratricopeptide (TPR) repeat protein